MLQRLARRATVGVAVRRSAGAVVVSRHRLATTAAGTSSGRANNSLPYPKLAVAGTLLRRSGPQPDAALQVLLVQRAKEPNKGFWALPGGSVELGETLSDAFRREMREETGLVLRGDAKPFTATDAIFTPHTLAVQTHRIDAGLTSIAAHERTSSNPVVFHYGIVHMLYALDAPHELRQRVVAADDALDARWFDVSDLMRDAAAAAATVVPAPPDAQGAAAAAGGVSAPSGRRYSAMVLSVVQLAHQIVGTAPYFPHFAAPPQQRL